MRSTAALTHKRLGYVDAPCKVRALLIHAENDKARSCYLSLAQFDRSPVDEYQLLLLTKDLRRALARE